MCVTGRTRKSVQYCNIAAAAAAAAAKKKNNRQLTCGKSWDVINEHVSVLRYRVQTKTSRYRTPIPI